MKNKCTPEPSLLCYELNKYDEKDNVSSHHRNGSCIDIRHVMGVNSSKEDTPKTNVALSWLSEIRR